MLKHKNEALYRLKSNNYIPKCFFISLRCCALLCGQISIKGKPQRNKEAFQDIMSLTIVF